MHELNSTPRTTRWPGVVPWVWAAAILVLSLPAVAQQTVYVKVQDAKIRSGAAATADVVATPAKGTTLTVLATDGPRYQVRTPDGTEGYISRLHVSATKPAEGGGLLSGLGHSDVKANESQTVASIRGLSPAAKAMATQKGLPEQCVKWAEKMETESSKVTKTQVDSFLKSENIGL